ncbi:methylthioribulose 1-phosphate dehydratase [Marinicellulosiphila megalodicopiae]|uniref:methylthioribulose 1-phosphate dehydratase n=1 Tax=Marinicellulosiphila megalodicopiae TaxID=2724896 RepID=UPI003BAFDAAC
MNTQQAISELIALGKWIGAKGWVPATGGNFSIRADDCFVVTASGFDKGALNNKCFLNVNSAGDILNGNGKPSAETALHLALYELSLDTHCVLHTHSVAATVLSRYIKGDVFSVSGYEMQKSLTGYTSHQDTLSIAIFDNDQDMNRLAQTVRDYFSNQSHKLQHGILIRGHGLYAFGQNPAQTKQHLEGLEFLFACELERIKLEAAL